MNDIIQPNLSTPMELEPEWIDYNGHLNMAYYNVLFDHGYDQFFEKLGLGADYATTRKHTTYTAEAHVRYLQELHLGAKVQVSMRILDLDAKRMHCFAELYHVDGWLAATCESMTLHVDMGGPKVAPFPEDILANLEGQFVKDKTLPKPEKAGQPIGIKRK